MTDATAWQEKLRMTRPCDPHGRVTEATHQKLQKTLLAISEALFGPNPSPEGTDQRLWSGGMHPFKEESPISYFSWIRCSFEGEVLSPLSFRILFTFRIISFDQVQYSFYLLLQATLWILSCYRLFELMLFEVFQFNIDFSYSCYCYFYSEDIFIPSRFIFLLLVLVKKSVTQELSNSTA